MLALDGGDGQADLVPTAIASRKDDAAEIFLVEGRYLVVLTMCTLRKGVRQTFFGYECAPAHCEISACYEESACPERRPINKSARKI